MLVFLALERRRSDSLLILLDLLILGQLFLDSLFLIRAAEHFTHVLSLGDLGAGPLVWYDAFYA